MPRPSPRPAPVTTQTLPFIENMSGSPSMKAAGACQHASANNKGHGHIILASRLLRRIISRPMSFDFAQDEVNSLSTSSLGLNEVEGQRGPFHAGDLELEFPPHGAGEIIEAVGDLEK